MKITFIKTGKRIKPKNEENRNITKKKTIPKQTGQKQIMQKQTVQKQSIQKQTPKKKSNENIFKEIIKKNQIVVVTVALMLITAGYMNYNNKKENDIKLAEIGDAKLVSANVIDDDLNENSSSNINANETKESNAEAQNSEVNEIIQNNETNNNEANTIEQNNETKNNETIATEQNKEANNNETNLIEQKDETNNIKETNSQINESDYFAKTKLERETMYSQMLEAYQKILENEKIPTDQKSIASNEIKNINDRINAISIAENLIKTKGFEDVILLINDNNVNVVVKRNENLKEEEVAQITNIVSRELKAEIENIHITIHK